MPMTDHTLDRRAVLAMGLGLAAAAAGGPARAQGYPARPVRLVVPWAPGGGSDFFARLAGARMAELIGQPVVIENRPGAASNLGADVVARAEPDGYTLLQGDMSTFAVNQHLYRELPFDAEKDFAPISLVVRFTTVLLSNPRKLAARSAGELIAAARAEPGGIAIAHVGIGSPFHLAAAQFQQAAGVTLNEVPYRGAGPAVQGLLGEDAHVMFVDYATARPHVLAGTLRALAVAAPEPSPALPGVPPLAATPGLAGFEISPWQGLVAPAGTPQPIIARLHDAHVAAVADPRVRRRLAESGAEPLSSTPEGFTAFRRREAARWGAVIRAAKIRPS